MPAEESTPAIVIRARDYADSDRIVTLLTLEAGKLSGIAKGAKASRHRFERKLEPFSHVMLHFKRRPHGQLVFITKAEAADLPQHVLDDDLGKIALGSYMLELSDALTTEESEAAEAYRILEAGLRTLAAMSLSASLKQSFELKILGWAGYGLEFARCRVCAEAVTAESDAMYFVLARGGIVCTRCRNSIPEGAIRMGALSAYALARLANATLADAPHLPASGAEGAAALARFISSILDRKLRSAAFLESILGGGA
ncbi:MAG TPA: DNA repair protein RecO [Candidatus Binataceae bacterium]|nr:DNA repair protein RecO [Candidatus Binataceae bacterium]